VGSEAVNHNESGVIVSSSSSSSISGAMNGVNGGRNRLQRGRASPPNRLATPPATDVSQSQSAAVDKDHTVSSSSHRRNARNVVGQQGHQLHDHLLCRSAGQSDLSTTTTSLSSRSQRIPGVFLLHGWLVMPSCVVCFSLRLFVDRLLVLVLMSQLLVQISVVRP